jgi:SAM-dependent methyltransferase
MLGRARARRVWPASFGFVEGNIDDVLARDERGFDRIASVNLIWTLADPQGTLARMAARLREGGRMVHTTPSWRFRAHVIVWRHLRGQRGWARLRALIGLPVLAFAGLLNLCLIADTMLRAHAPNAGKRWGADGLAELLRAVGAPPGTTKTCYAGQDVLLVCQKEESDTRATRLPVPGEHL